MDLPPHQSPNRSGTLSKLWLSFLRMQRRIVFFCPPKWGRDEVDLAHWMDQLPQEVKEKPLLSLTIPGSHDAGSYGLKTSYGFAPDQTELERAWWFKYFPRITLTISKRWTKTQAVDVTHQLMHGIRYLDLRGAPKIYQSDKGSKKLNATKLFFVHALYGPSLSRIASHVNEFLESHKGELVIIHFQHFHAVNPMVEQQFLDELMNLFGQKLCPFSAKNAQSSLHHLISKGYQVILFFPSNSQVSSDKVWPSEYLPNPWANTTDIKSLQQFLDENLKNRPTDRFYVTQGVLTPDHSYIRSHFVSSLRKSLSGPCNKFISKWLLDQVPGPKGPNIIMTDFVDWQDYELPHEIILKNYESCTPN